MTFKPLLQVKNLTVSHKQDGELFLAVSDVSFEIGVGETVSLIGESGCGKSSIAKAILGISSQYHGDIYYKGSKIAKNRRKALSFVKKDIQMIFQDPYSSLNPRMTIEEIIKEPLIIYKIGSKSEQSKRVDELLAATNLHSSYKHRFPHELSGGERQRVSIARALASNPKVLVCDEPTHALDMSVQASIINLLKDLRDEFNLSLLFISHDLTLVKNLSDRCLVMYGGKIVEEGDCSSIFGNPRHPFTRKLLSAAPLFSKGLHLYSKSISDEQSSSQPLSLDSRALHSYVQGIQSSTFKMYIKKKLAMFSFKKKATTYTDNNTCPYIQKCHDRKYICEKDSICSKQISKTHKVACLLGEDQKKSVFSGSSSTNRG